MNPTQNMTKMQPTAKTTATTVSTQSTASLQSITPREATSPKGTTTLSTITPRKEENTSTSSLTVSFEDQMKTIQINMKKREEDIDKKFAILGNTFTTYTTTTDTRLQELKASNHANTICNSACMLGIQELARNLKVCIPEPDALYAQAETLLTQNEVAPKLLNERTEEDLAHRMIQQQESPTNVTPEQSQVEEENETMTVEETANQTTGQQENRETAVEDPTEEQQENTNQVEKMEGLDDEVIQAEDQSDTGQSRVTTTQQLSPPGSSTGENRF